MICGIKNNTLLQHISFKKKNILSTKSAKLMKFSLLVYCKNIYNFCPHSVDILEAKFSFNSNIFVDPVNEDLKLTNQQNI